MLRAVPNRNIRYLAERLYGLGFGLAISGLALNDGSNSKKFGYWTAVGIVILVVSGIMSFVLVRKQIAANREAAATELKGKK